MKKIFTFSFSALLVSVLLAACVKQRSDIDESYWLSKERATVVYTDPYCEYYVIETMNGYSILRAWNSYKPHEGSVIYGDFSRYGMREFYNRSNGMIYTGEVVEYWLSYYDAQYAEEYYCY